MAGACLTTSMLRCCAMRQTLLLVVLRAAVAADSQAPSIPPAPDQLSAWRNLRWCPPDPVASSASLPSGGRSSCKDKAESRLLRSKFCEVLALPMHHKPCPEQWFAYLETTPGRWTASFPQCSDVRRILRPASASAYKRHQKRCVRSSHQRRGDTSATSSRSSGRQT